VLFYLLVTVIYNFRYIGYILHVCVSFCCVPSLFALYIWYFSVMSINCPLFIICTVFIVSCIFPYECPLLTVLCVPYTFSVISCVPYVFIKSSVESSTCLSNVVLCAFCAF
jgi:hypothetical protein